MTQAGATEAIASFAAGAHARCRGGDEGPTAVAAALVDTVGVALGGWDSAPVRLLERWLAGQGHAGTGTAWGSGRQLPPAQTALLNGTAAHALDWDDASPSMAMHPSAVLVPALLAAAAPGEPVPGLAAAYGAGAAVFRAVGEALPHRVHYGRGWHTTATVGRLAATAALARLHRLDVARTRHALGLAASCAAGSIANFGTMAKPLHAGQAAYDAVTSAGLAAAGFTANPAQLEDRGGFFGLYGAVAGPRDLTARLHHWEEHWPRDQVVKRYPACYGTHRAIDAALGLRAGAPAGRIVRADVTVHTGGTRPLLDRLPHDATEARFSLEYTLALALVHGRVEPAAFTARAFTGRNPADVRVRDLAQRVTVAEAPGPEHAEVRLGLADGTHRTRRVETTYGSAQNPLSTADFDAKFTAATQLPGRDAAALAHRLRAVVTAEAPLPDLRLPVRYEEGEVPA